MAKKKKIKKEIKGLTLFEVLDIITKKRKGELENFSSQVSIYMINRFLSMNCIYTEFINEIQRLSKVIDIYDYCKILKKILPSSSKFIPYIKKEKEKFKVKKKEQQTFDDLYATGYSKHRSNEAIILLREIEKGKK